MSKTKYLSGSYEVALDDYNDEPNGYYATVQMDSGWEVPDSPQTWDAPEEAERWAQKVIEIRDVFERDMKALGVDA